MRLRALGATSFLIAFLLLTPSALADELPTVPSDPTEPVVEDAMATLEEAQDELEGDDGSDEDTSPEDSRESRDDERRDDRDDGSDVAQDALQAAASMDDSVERLLTDLDLLELGDQGPASDEDAAPEVEDETPTYAPATQSEGAPRQVDLVTTTVIAAAAAGTVALAGKTGLLRFLSPAAFGLFSRFQGPKVLENPRRAELNRLVCRSPGVTVPDLCTSTGLSRNAVLHHLRMLEDQGMIVHRRMGRSTHWFENGGRYGRERKDAYAVLHDGRTRDVARFILEHPGSHQSAIGDALGLSPSVVHWHMKRLEDAALVQRERAGRSMLCFPGGPLADLSL